MSISNITAGMTPAQFKATYNANLANYTPIGQSVQARYNQKGHEVKSALSLNNLSDIAFGAKGNAFVASLNNSFTNLSLDDATIDGVSDVKTFGATGNGTTDDISAINSALVSGNIIIQNGTFKVSSAILIPSNRIIYIKNAKIWRANAVYDNIFRNTNISVGDSNISIIGLGHAEINGNGINNDYDSRGLVPPYYKYAFMFFCGVSNLNISNVSIVNWSKNMCYLQKCSNITIHDIYLDRQVLMVNQDFVVFINSHDAEVYNCTVKNGDDVFPVWATAIKGSAVVAYNGIADWNVGDTYNINIHDINVLDSNYGGLLVSMAGDGRKVYNINVERCNIIRGGSIYFNSYPASYFIDADCTKNELYGINMKKIRHESLNSGLSLRMHPIYFGQDSKNIVMTKIYNNTGKDMYKITGHSTVGYESLIRTGNPDLTDNVTINKTQVT